MSLYLENNNIHRQWKTASKSVFHRNFFNEHSEYLHSDLITMIYGLRRVWKTTIMKQYIDLLISQGIAATNICYYTFDIQASLLEVFETYTKRFGLDPHTTVLYFFFDEIQKVTNRQSQLKVLYDLYPHHHFIITWSSSLHLQKKESLAWRIFEFYMPPLQFDEYLKYLWEEKLLEQPAAFQESLQQHYLAYMDRQFIDCIGKSDTYINQYLSSLKQKVILEDIVAYFDIQYPQLLEVLFNTICYQPGMLLDYKQLSNDLNYDRRTIEKYLWYLEKSYLIRKLYNYSTNQLSSEKKLKRVYPLISGYITIHWIQERGAKFETTLINREQAKFFWRQWNKEVDMILIDQYRTPHAYEIKRVNTLTKKHTKWLQAFYKKFGKGTLNMMSQTTHEVGFELWDIIILPFWKDKNLGGI